MLHSFLVHSRDLFIFTQRMMPVSMMVAKVRSSISLGLLVHPEAAAAIPCLSGPLGGNWPPHGAACSSAIIVLQSQLNSEPATTNSRGPLI